MDYYLLATCILFSTQQCSDLSKFNFVLGPGWLNELGLYELLDPMTYHQYNVGSRLAL